MSAAGPVASAARGRVLHVMWSLNIGGAQRALYQLALGQRATGMDVGVLVASELGLYGERLEAAGVRIERLGQRRGYDALTSLRARSIFARWPLVHFHVAEPPLMAVAAATEARRYYTHRAGAFEYPLRRRLRYHAAGLILRHGFHGIVGNSSQAADAASRLFRIPRGDIGVVYNGIDWNLLRPERRPEDIREELALTTDRVVFGTSGNLRDCKRVDIAIRALQQTRSDVLLVIVGDGPERPALEQLARDFSVSHRVRFTGMRPNIADYLQVFDAFVLTSGPEESFGNSAVEAMGYGLPTIIMSDGGGLTEHVRHEQTGIVARSVDDLATWMNRLSMVQDLRTALGGRSREWTRAHYTVERMVQAHSILYTGAESPGLTQSAVGHRAAADVD